MKTRTRAEILAIVNQIERDFPVYDWNYDGMDAWPIIRRMVFTAMLEKKVTSLKKYATIKDSFIAPIKGFFLSGILKRRAKNVDFIFSANQIYRSNIVDDTYYNKFCDPIMDELGNCGYSSLLMEESKTSVYYTNIYKGERFIQLGFVIAFLDFKNRLRKKFLSTTEVSFNNYQKFLDYIEDIDPSLVKKISLRRISAILGRMATYKKWIISWLKYSKAKSIIQICYYGDWQQALCSAARSLNIPVFDIQHGIIYAEHYSYGNFEGIPSKGLNTLPNYFWTWSSFEESVINKWAGKTLVHKVVPFGNPWISAFLENKVPIKESVSSFLEKGKPLLLYTLGNRGENFPDYLVDFVKSKSDKFQFWIRLHPRQMPFKESIEKKMKELGILHLAHLHEASNLPLPEILKHTALHISLMSSVAIEAANFGVFSLILHEDGLTYYKEHEIKNYCYFLIDNHEQLNEKVNELLMKGKSIATGSSINDMSVSLLKML
jgi:hypothetical protein